LRSRSARLGQFAFFQRRFADFVGGCHRQRAQDFDLSGLLVSWQGSLAVHEQLVWSDRSLRIEGNKGLANLTRRTARDADTIPEP